MAINKEVFEQKIKELIDALYNNGWTPNINFLSKYQYEQFDLQTLVAGKKYEYYYWISGDKKYTMTIKKQVLTVHDTSRHYCKVFAVKLNDLEIAENYIQADKLRLYLK